MVTNAALMATKGFLQLLWRKKLKIGTFKLTKKIKNKW